MDTGATPQAQGANVGPNVIRANQFMLEDETGKVRAVLSVNKNGPGLFLLDENGNHRATLDVVKSGPMLTLDDENGKKIWSQPGRRLPWSTTRAGPGRLEVF